MPAFLYLRHSDPIFLRLLNKYPNNKSRLLCLATEQQKKETKQFMRNNVVRVGK